MDIFGLIALAKSQNGGAGKVFHFKGVKSTVNLLPIQGEEGDVYKVEGNNTYFAWNEEGWTDIGQLLSMDDVAALFDQVEDAGDEQVARIVAKGQEVEESIPENYTALSDEVDDLKSALNAVAIFETESGSIASFPDGADSVSVKNLSINIESQSGVTGATVTRTGINLFDKSTGIQLENTNLRVARNTGYGVPFLLRKGITYTISCNSTTPAIIYLIVPFTSQSIANSTNAVTSFAYTPTTDIDVGFNFYWYGGRPADANDIMLEIGNVKHDFTSYVADTYSITFPPEAGNITSGVIDAVNGTLSTGGNTYQITPINIETLYGTNNIWADCGQVSVEYQADTKLYIQKINAPTDNDMTADTQIASGKYFLIGNTLYLSTTVIPAGDAIIPGTNCTKTDLAAALNALNT